LAQQWWVSTYQQVESLTAYWVDGSVLVEYILMADDWSLQRQKVFGKWNQDFLADEAASLKSYCQ
jgi:hypothetical protein